MDETPLFLTHILLARLERISADSVWAHRASGVRGTLLRMSQTLEAGTAIDLRKYEKLSSLGFYILEEAAKEKRIDRKPSLK